MLVLLHRLHVVQIDFVAQQADVRQLAVFESALHELKPIFQVLERLLVGDVVDKEHLEGPTRTTWSEEVVGENRW